MALTGFNPTQVATSIGKVKNAYEDLIKEIGTNMQSKFVNRMASKWACKNAQDFFKNSFKPTIENLNSKTDATFNSVVAAMDSAADNWAKTTNSEYTKKGFTKRNIKISVDCIKEDINGVKGIDVSSANQVAASLDGIANAAKTALNNAKNAVNNCGFVGGSQQENLISSLNSINTSIDSAVRQIKTDVKKAISDTVTAYSDLEGKVSNAFQGK